MNEINDQDEDEDDEKKMQDPHTTIAVAIAIEWMVYYTTKLRSSGTKEKPWH
jgi:hypothetical protein